MININLRTCLFFCFFPIFSHAQLFVENNGYTVPMMVTDFFDSSCVTISNISYTGDPASMSFFEASQTNLGVNAGIFLCTGNYLNAVGPNSQPGKGTDLLRPGDPDFTALAGMSTDDATFLEFDLIPHADTLKFEYVFASEEYPEYALTSFNDVMAFFVSGPGIGNKVNMARIPGTTTPVGINTVNHITNNSYYINNNFQSGSPSSVEYDGYTTPLSVQFAVMQDSTYHVKIGLADASDGIYDSGLFLSVESLCGDSLLMSRPAFSYGRKGATYTFKNKTRYATSYLWDFGDGQFSTDRDPVHTYATIRKPYTVKLTSYNYAGAVETEFVLPALCEVYTPPNKYWYQPNPSEGIFSIDLGEEVQAEIEVYDIAGRRLFSSRFESTTLLDLNPYGKGMYLVAVLVNGQRQTTWINNQ